MSFAKIIARLVPVPAGVLYHYTTQAGLLGIINNREIWATHTQYLNDTNEFTHASDIVRNVIGEMRNLPEYSARTAILEQMVASIDGHESINVCVCSFSTLRDSLAQWRGYSGSGPGYAVGFDAATLSALAATHHFILAKCIYVESEQYELIRELVDIVLVEIQSWKPRHNHDKPKKGGNLAAYLNQVAPALKNPTFHEEQEWRLISRPLMCSTDRFAFREGQSMLLPYYRFPLETTGKTFSLEEVVVGPTPNMAQAISAAESLLMRYDLHIRNGELRQDFVNPSAIPFRNW